MKLKCLAFAIFSLINITLVASDKYVLTHEDKEWFWGSDYKKIEKKRNTLIEETEYMPTHNAILKHLVNKCINEPENKMQSLCKAIQFFELSFDALNHSKQKRFSFLELISQLENKRLSFNKQEEDIFFFKLFPYSPATAFCVDCQTPEVTNKIIYYAKPKIVSIKHCDYKKGDYYLDIENFFRPTNYCLLPYHGSYDTRISTAFKPIMYVDHNDATRYSYKEVSDIINIPLIATCFTILKKIKTKTMPQLFIPKVLIKKIIEENILHCSIERFKDIHDEGQKFIKYCTYVEDTVPVLLEKNPTNISPRILRTLYKTSEQFKKMYAELKSN